MKPIPLTQTERTFPLTDYAYQAGTRALSAPTAKGMLELRTFRGVSKDFFGGEAGRDYVIEATSFAIITALAAWPIAVMIHQLVRWVI
jgi:hypothetical protein